MSIHTATLADIYARQGHVDRALAIYRELADEHPDDERLQARIAELQAELSAQGPQAARARKVDRLKALLARIRSRRRRA